MPPLIATVLEWSGVAGAFLMGIYKKEVQDFLKGLFGRLHKRWFLRGIARRVSEDELKAILGSGLAGLETLLLLVLKEYGADRVTVVEYSEVAGGHLATCLVEVRQAEMPSVRSSIANRVLPPEVWEEVARIHHLPGRRYYVADARTLDIAVLRDALTSSGVWSAYYQSMPDTKGRQRGMLSVSWTTEHPLTPAQLDALFLSGSACATVLELIARWRPTEKP